ncbi:hypothetical protein [Jiangella alkaliphila]|uniref:DUF2269 domain-containing protein n=1 Tax=Jiangella alkaliphila TaxID=419479 RepID=A0A1H2M632_9ACTN|nr:hypothetical protein [Jiangella alkaliphila]SDU88398.1 hypothetical protein SAMN04488563_7090 [Jiangella alkaliphila]
MTTTTHTETPPAAQAAPATPGPAAPVAPARRPWRLGGRTRKAVLVTHILSAGAWFGMDIVMAVLVFTAIGTDSDETRALVFQALELFAIWPLAIAGLVCLASGVLLGLGSKYGLVRFWWVAVKLVLNVLLSTLVLLALRPGVQEAAEQGRLLGTGVTVQLEPADMIYPPVVSTTLLLVAFLLSVFKPWGRISRRRG